MPLRVQIDLVGYYGVDKHLSDFYIGREELLKNGKDAIYGYSISPQIHPWEALTTFEHQYSDGANVCVLKALQALEDLKQNPPE